MPTTSTATGYDVTVVAEVDTPDTGSAVAAALWFPHDSEHSDAATRRLERSRDRFDDLADDPATGVLLRTGTVVERRVDVDRTWMRMAPDAVEIPRGDLPAGAVSAFARPFVRRTVDDVSSLRESADVVVVATGIRGGELLGDDDSPYPIRGQVLRLVNPGLTEWITDDENPADITYVFPRGDDVIVGRTGDANVWETSSVDQLVGDDIIYRSRVIARRGLGRMLKDLDSSVAWRDGSVIVDHTEQVTINLADAV